MGDGGPPRWRFSPSQVRAGRLAIAMPTEDRTCQFFITSPHRTWMAHTVQGEVRPVKIANVPGRRRE
jgi:hypothetical protein